AVDLSVECVRVNRGLAEVGVHIAHVNAVDPIDRLDDLELDELPDHVIDPRDDVWTLARGHCRRDRAGEVWLVDQVDGEVGVLLRVGVEDRLLGVEVGALPVVPDRYRAAAGEGWAVVWSGPATRGN